MTEPARERTHSPKVLIVPFDVSGKRVAIVDYTKCRIIEAKVIYPKEDGDHVIRLKLDRIIIHGCPKSVEVVAGDLKGTRYNVVWLTGYKRVPELTLTDYTAEQVVRALRAWSLIVYKRFGGRVIKALLPMYALARLTLQG